MSEIERFELDARGHTPRCPHFGKVSQVDPNCTYVDLFCDCHRWNQPTVLGNGTDVAWPTDWTQKQALAWRSTHKLVKPQTCLEKLAEDGNLRLVTTDPEMIARAARANEGLVETFVYWSGTEQETVVGSVKDEYREGDIFRFTVSPEQPGAHAI